ncbi:MAG: hypothetical protein O2973_09815 [Gemmatimonadetes bacterium]|nr:hypothetical protein [Gemmatimonadota bacterium]
MKQLSLRPGDVVVALQLALLPVSRLEDISSATLRSLGEVHNAVVRLRSARLLKPEAREVVREPLLNFIRWGVPFAFPAVVGGMALGVTTGVVPSSGLGANQSANSAEVASSEFVWPSSTGTTRGQALVPLYARAPELVAINPALRTLLSLVDLIRIGGAREGSNAIAAIAHELTRIDTKDGV